MDNSNEEPIYQATLSFISRGQLRGGISWSTKRVKAALSKMGFTCEPYYLPNKPNALVQKVELVGTREEVIRDRQLITTRLRNMSSGKMEMAFKLKEE